MASPAASRPKAAPYTSRGTTGPGPSRIEKDMNAGSGGDQDAEQGEQDAKRPGAVGPDPRRPAGTRSPTGPLGRSGQNFQPVNQ